MTDAQINKLITILEKINSNLSKMVQNTKRQKQIRSKINNHSINIPLISSSGDFGVNNQSTK